ncbi:hypothetical protein WMF27_09310 [Sorangium sp. So ce281]|uniref:hypothetical protein n=1 Tax=unclassified Sorangium TaxID=2621164 RepID=UPI003F5D67CC
MKYPILAACALLMTSACSGEIEPKEDPTGETHDQFRTWWLGIDHNDLTEEALTFLSEDVADEVGDHNEDTDSGYPEYKSRYHVDNCRIPDAFDSIRERYADVVSLLNPASLSRYDAKQVFGTILHTVQDFYAHSNWMEADQTTLFDQNRFRFPYAEPGRMLGGMMVLTNALPSSYTIDLPDGSRVPIVTVAGSTSTKKGLITGTYEDNEDSSICPPEASIEHGDTLFQGDYDEFLSKDDPDSPHHDEAASFARWQTKEEFCRLARLVLLRYGNPGLDTLLDVFEASRSGYEAACPNDRSLVSSVITSTI